MNDIFLLRLLKSGDKQVFKLLFDSYFEALCRFMYIYLGNKQDAEEIAIDILCIFGKIEKRSRLS